MLDMLELHLDVETFRRMGQFKTPKVPVGLRPMVVFAGAAFESAVPDEYTLAKSMLLDFFRGEPADKVDVEGLRYVVSVTAEEPSQAGDGGVRPPVRVRIYLIRTMRSGQKLPRVEVEEMGPRMDFRLGRMREADAAMLKEALRKARGSEERTKKNISTDSLGHKMGRIHLGRQDLGELQTRKMKGLKRSRAQAVEEGMDEAADDPAGASSDNEEPAPKGKKRRS